MPKPQIRLAAAFLAALSLTACENPSEPGEQAQEQLVFVRFRTPGYNGLSDTADIYRVNADGTGLVNLTAHPASYGALAPSPDGRTVLFESTRGDGVRRVWTMGSDGAGARPLANDFSNTPRWSPDGSRIAFMMVASGDGEHVYVTGAGGGDPVKVSGPAMEVGGSCGARTSIELIGWLPDGRIAFGRHYCGFGYRYFTVNADGSGFAQTETRLNELFWSPDGARIAYLGSGGGHIQVMVMNADGGDAHLLAPQGMQQGLPWVNDFRSPWSPDSRRVLFFAGGGAGQAAPRSCSDQAVAYVASVDGSAVQRLMDDCRAQFHGWSGSGEKLAFLSWPETGSSELYVMNTDGSGAVNVSNNDVYELDAQWLPRR